jgi:asparagine synthase (glutamine-hydrolysing)
MCGIFGLATIGRLQDDLEIVRESVERVRHRGPDRLNIVSFGCDGRWMTLGHARLAVVDGVNAIQPLQWTNNKSLFHLVVNGEIYNYQELREELVTSALCKPDEFKTNGDSEVLLACLVQRGLEWTLKHVVGMYAFVLIESTSCNGQIHSITMCRDVFGIKPLCYGLDRQQKTLAISSEMAAIPESFRCVHIKDVLPSTYVKVECRIECETLCWSLTETAYRKDLGLKSIGSLKNIERNIPITLIRQRLIEAVTLRIPKDGVKWGVLLSGGLDSSLIASIAADIVYPSPLHTFTITFSQDNGGVGLVADSDMYYARIVANSRPNIIHDEVTFSFQDGLDVLPAVIIRVETMDVAVVRASVPLYLLSRYVSSKHFKVVLCGEGADESFAGK